MRSNGAITRARLIDDSSLIEDSLNKRVSKWESLSYPIGQIHWLVHYFLPRSNGSQSDAWSSYSELQRWIHLSEEIVWIKMVKSGSRQRASSGCHQRDQRCQQSKKSSKPTKRNEYSRWRPEESSRMQSSYRAHRCGKQKATHIENWRTRKISFPSSSTVSIFHWEAFEAGDWRTVSSAWVQFSSLRNLKTKFEGKGFFFPSKLTFNQTRPFNLKLFKQLRWYK